MSKTPYISVMMPVYNCEQYVREAIESILKQSLSDFEFIIINDGSTDNTPEILNEYANRDSRIKIINQDHSAIGDIPRYAIALNRGLYEAKGKWIFRMDGDDISLPDRFAIQLEAINKNPALVLLGGWCQQINLEGLPLKINKFPARNKNLINELKAFKAPCPHPTACFRRDLSLKLGGYRERFCPAEDFDLWFRLSSYGELGCCQRVILKLRKHSENVSDLDSGRLQPIRAIAAYICNFRGELGLSNHMGEEEWNEFLMWIELRLEEERFFKQVIGWQSLRSIWLTKLKENKLKKMLMIIELLKSNHLVINALIKNFKKENIALKLAIESEDIFNDKETI